MDQQEETTLEFPVEDLTVSEVGAAEVKGGAEAGAGKLTISDFSVLKKYDK